MLRNSVQLSHIEKKDAVPDFRSSLATKLMTMRSLRWFILGAASWLALSCVSKIAVLSTHAQQASGTRSALSAWQAAVAAADQNDFPKALQQSDAARRSGLTDPRAFYWRGRWHFRVGNVKASLREFDRYVAARPQRANSQWERGITCYYAGKFRQGAKQFVDYQTFHDNDVENAVWRYLCQVKFDSKQKALAAMLPIKNDTRVPMMEIYELFRGKSRPEKVLALVEQSKAPKPVARHQRFDAHLYLGLYYHAEGNRAAASKHIDLAVQQYEQGDYMWAVAVQHQKLLAIEKQRDAEEAKKRPRDPGSSAASKPS